jgi:hypothetical protein
MNVFFEFYKVVRHFRKDKIEYALVGGVALAFYGAPRFTRDIDILTKKSELVRISALLKREGYFESSQPWTFKDTKLTLHRFLKIKNGDEMIIDIMVAGTARHARIVENAIEAVSEDMGAVRVAAKRDLVWLKRSRNSKQDQADLERLTREDA